MSRDGSASPPTPQMEPTPVSSLVPDSINDMFDLAAPPLEQPAVARLLPLSGQLQTIDLRPDSGAVVLGRGTHLPPPYRIAGAAKLSSKHCTLVVDPTTLRVTLTDTSTNGTYVNGKRLAKDQAVPLEQGDTIALTKPVGREAEAAPGEPAEKVEYLFNRLREEVTVSDLEKELQCSICRTLFLRPCSVLPCMHVFCASCISQWLAQQPTCAECRQPVHEVRPTHKIQSCVEQLIASNPGKYARSEAEVKEREALDTIPPAGKVIAGAKRPREEQDDYDADEEEDEDRSDLSGEDEEGRPLRQVHYAPTGLGQQAAQRCVQCEAPSAFDAFRCPEHGPHLRCGACHRLYPERPLCGRPQRCQLCSTPYCNLYMEGEAQPCLAQALRPLPDHPQTIIPPQTFRGNATELAILTTYLAAHSKTAPAVWEECLRKLREGEWVPDLTSMQGALTAQSVVCARCAQTIFSALLFHYRRAIPAEELPESVTKRPHCWYGVNCRTQFSKLQHAQNYNHVCYQEKRKE